jgi:hypothetical protein
MRAMNYSTSPYTRIRTSYRVRAADGTILNHGWGDAHRANEDAARLGGYVEPHTYESEVPACERVLIDSGIPTEDHTLCRLAMQRMLNMALDAGRPSDAMRSVVAAYKRGDTL